MHQVTKLPTISRSKYLKERLIPVLEKELAESTNWRSEREKNDRERLLEAYKTQLKNIENGIEEDNVFPDLAIEVDTETGNRTEKPRTEND